MILFDLKDLSAGYNNVPVIKDITLTIKEGDFIGIIGPNGAGKSTLLKCLARTLTPFTGTIAYKGRPISELQHKQFACQVAVVVGIEHILPYSVHSFVSFGRFPHSQFTGFSTTDIDAINNTMKYCNVEHIKNKKLTQLSSGELQRVNIARALAQSTQCILLDEPISYLDIHHTTAVMDILRTLNQSGSTIVSILHDINIASEYCNRIVAMKNGTIQFDDRPEDCITYQNIEALFDCVCLVYENPISKKPYIYPVPAHIKHFQSQ